MHALLSLWLCAVPSGQFASSAGGVVALDHEVAKHALTVLVFFSADCPVLKAHDARVVQLAAQFSSKEVAFFSVHSSVESSVEADAEAARARKYSFPLLNDPGARVADALDVRFSATVVVLDRGGVIRYRGGIDSDQVKLHEDTQPYVRNALTALVSGKQVNPAETKSLGCVLRRP